MCTFKQFGQKMAAGATVAIALMSGAYAAIPAAATTAISEAQSDGSELGWAILVFIIVIAAVKNLRRAA